MRIFNSIQRSFFFRSLLILPFVIGLLCCTKNKEPIATSPIAQAYINEVVGRMQQWSINRNTIDWASFKQQVTDKGEGAQTIADTYPAIQLALTLLGDNHSIYSYPSTTGGVRVIRGDRTVTCSAPAPSISAINYKVGYIKLPPSGKYDEFGVKQGLLGVEYAQAIQDAIKAVDNDGIQGWIVDLRGNTGGDSWAMVVGVGPILGEGLAGYITNPNGNYSKWGYEKGGAFYVDQPIYTLPILYTLRKQNPKVAVLTDQATASAGEGVAVAFKGRANTRSFGEPTCGLSTFNTNFILSDQAVLTLTVSTLVDRNKNVYGKQVIPDEVLPINSVIEKASSWLLQ